MNKHLILKITLLFITLFNCSISFSQKIFGVILDGNTNNPIEGVSIYFDNTTIGTTTNDKGEFSLEYKKGFETSLVFSFIGYETIIYDEFDSGEKMEIYLYESNEVLDEVLITSKNAWSRELKLKEFLKHYLGESNNGKSCRILNKDDIILRYDKSKKQLTARANSPILIKNNNLKYLITVELDHFEVNYSSVSKNKKRLNLSYVFYSGANFYKSLQDNPTKKTLEKRKEAYEGSVLHFMRAIAQENLKKDGYRIYLGDNPVNSNRFIKVSPIENSNNVYVKLKSKLNILYKRGQQSSVENFVDEFYIDHFGNHSPSEQVRFGGNLGKQRMGDALPLDFLLIKHKDFKSL